MKKEGSRVKKTGSEGEKERLRVKKKGCPMSFYEEPFADALGKNTHKPKPETLKFIDITLHVLCAYMQFMSIFCTFPGAHGTHIFQ